MPDLFLLKDELLRFLAEKGARLPGVGNLEGITDGALKTGLRRRSRSAAHCARSGDCADQGIL